MAWSANTLASGSRDRNIYLQDARIRCHHRIPPRISSTSSGEGTMATASLPRSATIADSLRAADLTPPRSPAPSFHALAPLPASLSTEHLSLLRSSSLFTPQTAERLGVSYSLSTASPSLPTPSPSVIKVLSAHRQEVCGLKWSLDDKMLASGGNDNKLLVWEPLHGGHAPSPSNPPHAAVSPSRSADNIVRTPLYRFEDHTAAVKAVSWSPHVHGLLASGGGTADRHIRFWSTSTGLPLHKVDTASQVCNLCWSKNSCELVSTHGYSLNQVIIWKYPSMQKVATLSGHSLR
jgi:WD40 repeat protein